MKRLLTIALIAASSLTAISAQAGRYEGGEYTGRWASATDSAIEYGVKQFNGCYGGGLVHAHVKAITHNVTEALYVRDGEKVDIDKVENYELADWSYWASKGITCLKKQNKTDDIELLQSIVDWADKTIADRREANKLAKELEQQRKKDEWNNMSPAEKCKIYNTRYVQHTEAYTKQQHLVETLTDTYKAERRMAFHKNMMNNQLESIRANGCELTFKKSS